MASPPDVDRSSKCFQKAFELDAREGEAARKLADGFAEEREWDLVEVVARRTIQGEGGLEGGKVGKETTISTRYQPTNAWAWKAIGVVELVSLNLAACIWLLMIDHRTDAIILRQHNHSRLLYVPTRMTSSLGRGWGRRI